MSLAEDGRHPARLGCAVFVALAAALGPAASLLADPAAASPNVSRLEADLERFRARWKVPGMAAGVAIGVHTVWTRGFGHAAPRCS
jgi:CubicO group peptidase (beta-lactamase class C family)